MLILTLLALVYVAGAAAFAGWLRTRRGVRAPYTRKIFHFVMITPAVVVHLGWGFEGVLVYGGVIAAAVLFALLRGSGFPFYEALARPTDAPHRTLYIIVPLVTTAVGGLLTNVLFPAWAHVGYMAVAWGDAVGEPVGTRWGRHRYRVPSIAGVPATRSIEGSAAVFLATTAAVWIALAVSGVAGWPAFTTSLIIAVAATATEAVSHHGIDNLTLQLVAAAGAALLQG